MTVCLQEMSNERSTYMKKNKTLTFLIATLVTFISGLTNTISVFAYSYYDYYNGVPSSSGYGGTESIMDSILDEFQGYSFNDLLDSVASLIGPELLFIPFVIAVTLCFLGYKLYRILISICGFLIGGILGLFLYGAFDSKIFLLIGVILAIAGAVVAYKFYQIGLFMYGSSISFVILSIIFLVMLQSKAAFIISAILAVVAGVLFVMFNKPVIILSTSINHGFSAGTLLSCMIAHTRLSGLFGIIFVGAGLYLQTKMNGGLLESGSFIEMVKNKYGGHYVSKATTSSGDGVICPSCGAENAAGSDFCMECGVKIPKTKTKATSISGDGVICSSCGAENVAGSDFCMECGAKISKTKDKTTSIPDDKITCSSCGTKNIASSMFCINCGSDLTKKSTSFSETPVMPALDTSSSKIKNSFKYSSSFSISNPETKSIGNPETKIERKVPPASSGTVKSSFKPSSSFSVSNTEMKAENKISHSSASAVKSSFRPSSDSFSNSETAEKSSSRLKGTLKKS